MDNSADAVGRHLILYLSNHPMLIAIPLTGIEWLVHVFDLNLTTQILIFPC